MRTPWWFLVWAGVGLLAWAAIIYVAVHFIAKWW